MPNLPTPREIRPTQKTYAFERALGTMPAEAVRRAGGNIRHGQATKWERSPRVQAWIKYYREIGHVQEILQARIQRRLQAAE